VSDKSSRTSRRAERAARAAARRADFRARRTRRLPHEDPRAEVRIGVGVRVGPVEFKLYEQKGKTHLFLRVSRRISSGVAVTLHYNYYKASTVNSFYCLRTEALLHLPTTEKTSLQHVVFGQPR